MNVAIIDLGTNTFNLLIAEIKKDHSFEILVSEKLPVKLGEGGINKRYMTPLAMERGLAAIDLHLKTIQVFHVEKIYAFGTSAIRSAENGNEFARKIKENFNLTVDIITGEEEAELIFSGVKQCYPVKEKPVLVLDIGGGSNEFIIGTGKEVLWKKSYNLGMARLLEKFSPEDPIKTDEIQQIENYLEHELHELMVANHTFKPEILIGSSGTFDTFSDMLVKENKLHPPDTLYFPIPLEEYNVLHSRLLVSTLEERKKMQGMEPVRVEMIVLASIFVNFTLQKTAIKRLIQSPFSLKEGVIARVIQKLKTR